MNVEYGRKEEDRLVRYFIVTMTGKCFLSLLLSDDLFTLLTLRVSLVTE